MTSFHYVSILFFLPKFTLLCFFPGKYLRQKRIDFQLPYDILWLWKHDQVINHVEHLVSLGFFHTHSKLLMGNFKRNSLSEGSHKYLFLTLNPFVFTTMFCVLALQEA